MAITLNFKAEEREGKGTGNSKALRRQGKIPAVVYSKGKVNAHLTLDAKELTVAHNKGKFFSRVIEFDTGKEKIKTIPQDIQFHPVKDTPLHADFVKVDEKSEFKVSIPVEFTNSDRSQGLKRGGVLNVVRRAVEVYCTIAHIPEKFTANLGPLGIGENIKYSQLEGADQVRPVISDRDFTIATIAGRISKEAEEALEAENTEAIAKAAEEKKAADAAATAAAKEGKTKG